MSTNQRAYRYIGRDDDAPPIQFGGRTVNAGDIVDDPSINDTDARFMAILNPAYGAPIEPAPGPAVDPVVAAPVAAEAVLEPPDQPPAKEPSP